MPFSGGFMCTAKNNALEADITTVIGAFRGGLLFPPQKTILIEAFFHRRSLKVIFSIIY